MAQTSTQSALPVESAVLDDFASPLSAAQTSHVPTRCERTSSHCPINLSNHSLESMYTLFPLAPWDLCDYPHAHT